MTATAAAVISRGACPRAWARIIWTLFLRVVTRTPLALALVSGVNVLAA